MPDEIDIIVARAEHLLDIGRAEEAVGLLLGDSRSGNDAGALVVLAHCYHRLDRDAEAEDAAERCLAIDPERVGGWMMLALSRLAAGRPVDAVPPATRAIELAPWFYGAHSMMSRVLAELGRFPQATVHAHKTMELDPDGTSGWIALCRLALAQQKWDEAAMAATEALSREPENDEARVLLSVAQVNSTSPGGRAMAMETLVATLRDNPDQDAVRKFLIEVALHSRPKPQLWLPIIAISFFTGGLGLILLLIVWSVTLYQLWQSIPADIRRLIWADRQARYKILAVGTVVGAIWLVVLGGLVVVTIGVMTGSTA